MYFVRTALRPTLRRCFSSFEKLQNLTVDLSNGKGVAVLTLNRPKALNALNDHLMAELNDTLKTLDKVGF